MVKSCVLALVVIGAQFHAAESAEEKKPTPSIVESAIEDSNNLTAMFKLEDTELTPHRAAWACMRMAGFHDKLDMISNLTVDPKNEAEVKANGIFREAARDTERLSTAYCSQETDSTVSTSEARRALVATHDKLARIESPTVGHPDPTTINLKDFAARTNSLEQDLAKELKSIEGQNLNAAERRHEFSRVCYQLGHTILATQNLRLWTILKSRVTNTMPDATCNISMKRLEKDWIETSTGFCALEDPGQVAPHVVAAVEANGKKMSEITSSCIAP